MSRTITKGEYYIILTLNFVGDKNYCIVFYIRLNEFNLLPVNISDCGDFLKFKRLFKIHIFNVIENIFLDVYVFFLYSYGF